MDSFGKREWAAIRVVGMFAVVLAWAAARCEFFLVSF